MGSHITSGSAAAYTAGASYTPTPEEIEWLRTATWGEVIDTLGRAAAYLHHTADRQTDGNIRSELRGSAKIIKHVQAKAGIWMESISIESP